MKWLCSIRLRQILATAFGLLVLLAVLDELETTEISTTQSAPSPQAYIASVVQPKAEKQMPTLNKLGQIEATKIIELSSDVGGRIIAASPDYRRGRILSAQQWLLQIDPLPYKAAEAAAHVALMNANMALKNARAQYAPSSLMVQTAQADLDYYQLQYQQAQQDLKRTRIALPFAGELVELKAHVGEHIAAGQSIASVLPRGGEHIRITLSAKEFDALATPLLGQQATIHDVNGNIVGQASITGVSHYSEQLQRQLFLTLEGSHSLLVGQHVRAQLPLKPWNNVFSVPESSLTANHEIWFLDAQQRAHKQRLQAFIVQHERVFFDWPLTNNAHPHMDVLVYPRDSLAQGMSIETRSANSNTGTLSQEQTL
ncbi:hypothetical protein GCM10011297_15210 [Bacterioplanes sanyensis]|uniref:hypothetical protein n=1 Tax=Bacterioplanes sanyensis TaxID=1249553 RepID=UPI00167263A3|nr:hypothetical protein [Bacterioplanes sanyensis]GGY43381.1 hypothetical protein GCM10011297_15210 [Bacterioplanes sanyensis]